jgi:peptidyl-tRNA hydrolase
MKPVMYIFANRGLGMSPGKLAAQVAHAAVEAYRISCFENPSKPSGSGLIESSIVKEWYRGGHHTKLVMLARDTEHLYTIERYLQKSATSTTKLIIDEGRTEIAAHSPTALALVEVVWIRMISDIAGRTYSNHSRPTAKRR